MTINLVVKVDTKKIIKSMDTMLKSKIPNATKNAINRTGNTAINDLKGQLSTRLDRPTPFTQKAFGLQPAKVKHLRAIIFIKRIQQQYLKYQIEGGTGTRPKATPARSWPVNAYGNLPRRTTKRKNVYIGELKNGRKAYYLLRGGAKSKRLDLIAFITRSRHYRKRYPFFAIGEASILRHYTYKFRSEYNKIL